eukprot:7377966-Pyramimonas_sp.AAC.2
MSSAQHTHFRERVREYDPARTHALAILPSLPTQSWRGRIQNLKPANIMAAVVRRLDGAPRPSLETNSREATAVA